MTDREPKALPPKDDNDGTGELKGLDALHVSVMTPDNEEAKLQFQWMRPHPMSAIALSEDISSPAVQVSRMLPHYRAAMNRRSDVEGNEQAGQCSMVDSPFFQASGVQVDLCDLFDPPLLSESIPTIISSCSKDSTREEVETSKPSAKHPRLSTTIDKQNMKDSDGIRILDKILNAAIVEMDVQSDPGVGANSLSDQVTPLTTLSQGELIASIPSQMVLDKIAENTSHVSESDEHPASSRNANEVAVLALVLLAEHGAGENIGRYILGVLAPVVLHHCDKSSPCPGLKRLSLALVSACSMWKLPRAELLDLISDDHDMPSSAALTELASCIAESYYEVKQSYSLE